jgi:hypothetical protein
VTDAPVTIFDEVECVEREVRLREQVYPRRVSQGKMTQAQATRELARMRAVLARLQRTAEGERLL